ncbi:TetR/AcrR family transcriptional regulator [Leifsonia kafniensis]|uniref:TetR/AcrR family transcriptional regulator n=1 Tax=Leifsonia kafniensis TaxID=475957 RepID=UPI0031EE8B9B
MRQRIIDASIEVFGATGYYGTTMKDIAAAVGISQMGLAHHFPSKEALLTATIEWRDKQSENFFTPAEYGLDSLLVYIAVVVEDQKQPGLVELQTILAGESTTASHPAHATHQARYRDLRLYLTRTFQALADQGDLVSALPSETLASTMIALSDGLHIQWLLDPDAVDVGAALRGFVLSVVATELPEPHLPTADR